MVYLELNLMEIKRLQGHFINYWFVFEMIRKNQKSKHFDPEKTIWVTTIVFVLFLI